MSETYDFYVTSEPPDMGTPFGGHRAGRVRTNPFDDPIRQTHERDFASRDEWLEFKTDPSDIPKAVNRIRSAGQYLKLGTEVRVDREAGRIAFRGVEYRPRLRQPKADAQPATELPDPDLSPPAPDTRIGGSDASTPQAQPWEWPAQQSAR